MYGLAGNGALLLTTVTSLLASPAWASPHGSPEALPRSSSVSVISDVDTYGAYVTLDIGDRRGLTLRLDLLDTDTACNQSVPSVYWQSLPSSPISGQEGHTEGKGQLTLGDESGPVVEARWTRECIVDDDEGYNLEYGPPPEVGQRLEMTIESVDGDVLDPEVSFVAVLEALYDVDSSGLPLVSHSLRLESEDFSRRPKMYVSSSAFGRYGGSGKKEAVADMEKTPESSIWTCGGFRCIIDSLRARFDSLRQSFYEWRHPEQQHVSGNADELQSYTAWYQSEENHTEDCDPRAANCSRIEEEEEEEGGQEEESVNPDLEHEDLDCDPKAADCYLEEEAEAHGDSLSAHASEQQEHEHEQQTEQQNEQQNEQQRVKPVDPTKAGSHILMATPTHTPFAIPSISPPDKTLVMTLVLAVVAFTMFSLSSICLIRMQYTPAIERRPRPTMHRETSEERQARVAMRQEAVRSFFQGFFCGLFTLNEKDCEEAAVAGPQGRDLRGEVSGAMTESYRPVSGGEDTDDDDNSSTTMEQELAGFREAASLVSSLIAAEQGRQQMQRPQPGPIITSTTPSPAPFTPYPAAAYDYTPAPAPPSHPMYPYAGYDYRPPSSGLASPPSYEAEEAETSMISDGFRYSPGQFEFQYSPSSSPGAGPPGNTFNNNNNNSNSDRLGYGNKD